MISVLATVCQAGSFFPYLGIKMILRGINSSKKNVIKMKKRENSRHFQTRKMIYLHHNYEVIIAFVHENRGTFVMVHMLIFHIMALFSMMRTKITCILFYDVSRVIRV